MKILEFFAENRQEFVEHCKLIMIWRMISIWQVKISNLPANFARLDLKGRKMWIFWDFLIKISLENGLFSQFLTKYFLEFCLLSESIILMEENTRFLQQFFLFREGEVTASSSVGRGGTPERPPRNREIVLEICLSSRGIYFRIWVRNPRNI